MSDSIDKLLHLAMAGPFADFALPEEAAEADQLDEALDPFQRMTVDDMIRAWIKKHGKTGLDRLIKTIKKKVRGIESASINKRLAIVGGISEGDDLDMLSPEERMLLGLERGSSSGPWFGDDMPAGPRPLMEGDTSGYFPQPMTLDEHRSDALPLVEEVLDCAEPTVSFSAGPCLDETYTPEQMKRYKRGGGKPGSVGDWLYHFDEMDIRPQWVKRARSMMGAEEFDSSCVKALARKDQKQVVEFLEGNKKAEAMAKVLNYASGAKTEELIHEERSFKRGDVVKFKGKRERRRYVITFVDQFGMHNMVALSGSERGSAPSGHKTSELELDKDQSIVFSGKKAKQLFRRYDQYQGAHWGGKINKPHKVSEDEALSEMEAGDIDGQMKIIRAKVIKGAKPTRARRLAGCLRALRTGGITVSGQSQTNLNPVPKAERNKEDQPKDDTPGEVDEDTGPPDQVNTEDVMNLSDAIRRFRGEDEEPAPRPARKPQTESHGARPAYGESFDDLRDKGMALDDFGSFDDDGDVEFAEAMLNNDPTLTGMDRRLAQLEANIPVKGGKSKSKFRQPYKGPGKGVYGPVSTPADPEAKAAATRSTAGVKGPGYTPDGREEVDVRTEQREPATAHELDLFAEGMEYPTDLIGR